MARRGVANARALGDSSPPPRMRFLLVGLVALALARSALATPGTHCTTNANDLAPCMTSPGSVACCTAINAWNAKGCFCDGVATSLTTTQSAGATQFAQACSITRTTSSSDATCAQALTNQGASSTSSSPPPPSPSTGPDAPTNVYALRTGASEITLAWTASASSGVVAYAIDACDAANLTTCASPTRTTVSAAAGTSYVFSGVTNPTTVVYRIKAATLTESSMSSPATAVPALDARQSLLVSTASSASSVSSCGSWATPCDSINTALSATTSTTTRSILVLPGTHTSSCGSSLGSSGAVNIASVLGATTAILDCAETARGFDISGSDAVSISGVTIKRGLAATGGGIKILNASTVTIDSVDVVQCKSLTMGGGLHAINSPVTVRHSRFMSCSGGNDNSGNNVRGGGAYLQTNSHATLTNVSFIGNTLVDSGKGAGLNVDGNSNITANGLTLTNNRAFFAAGLFIGQGCHGSFSNVIATGNEASYGAAIGIFVGGKPTFNTGLISKNVATLWGAGVIVYTGAYAEFTGFSFEDNMAEIGAGIFMYSQSRAKVSNSRVLSNHVSKYGAGMRLEDRSVLEMENSRVSHNIAKLGAGGAHVTSGSSLTLTGGEFVNNTAPNGAGLICDGGVHGGGRIISSGVTIQSNVASGLGGAMYLAGACEARVTGSSIVESNSAVSGSSCRSLYVVGGGAFALLPNTPTAPTKLTLDDSTIVRENEAPTGGAIFVIPAASSADTNSPRGAQITVTSATLSANRAIGCQSTIPGRGGAMFIAAGNHTFTQVSLTDNGATSDGGAVFTAGVGAFTMNMCTATANNATKNGGAVSHEGAKLKIVGGEIQSNVAMSGGGVYIASTASTQPAFAILGSSLKGNTATRGGAMYFATNLALGSLQQLSLDTNSATSGADAYWLRSSSANVEYTCASCAYAHGSGVTSRIVATEALASTAQTALKSRVQSGKVTDDFSVQLVDFYGQPVTSELTSVTCSVSPLTGASPHARHNLEISGSSSSATSAGVATFSGSILRGELGKDYTARVTCTRDTTMTLTSISALDIPVKIGFCLAGSEPIVVTYADGVAVARECTVCKDRTFNFDGVKCQTCPMGGDCRGGASLESLPGWWRSSDSAEVLFSCPVRESCVAGNATGTRACEIGYEGPVCALCAKGYRAWGGKCSKCGSNAALAVPALGIIAFTAFFVYIFRKPLKQVAGTVVFSTILFVAQILGLLKEYDIAWPSSVGRLVEVLDITNFNMESLTPGCSASESNYYSTYVAAVIVPPAVTIFCLILYFVMGLIARNLPYARLAAIASDAQKKCRRNAAWLVVLSYSGVAKTVLQLYNQRHLDVGVFMRRDYSIVTSTEEHLVYRITGFVALLLYPIGIPLGITYILVRNRHRLDHPEVEHNFGFLYVNVREQLPFWELTGLFLKFVLAAVPVFANDRLLRAKKSALDTASDFNGVTQLSIAQLVVGILFIAVVAVRPYRKSLHNVQFSLALGVIFSFITLSANVFNAEDTYSQKEKTGVAAVAVALATVVMSIAIVKSALVGEFASKSDAKLDDKPGKPIDGSDSTVALKSVV